MTHTNDYPIGMLPLTEKFYRNACPDYFDNFRSYRDELRNEINDERWRQKMVALCMEQEPS